MRASGAEPLHVFGYGSLLDLALPARGTVPARLRGFRRGWGVAMDNRRAIPGYKRYVDPLSGDCPPVFVTYLDIARDAGAWLNGAVIAAPPELASALDRRERNYERHDVTELVDVDVGAPVWAFVGRAAARDRCRAARAAGTAVVSRAYLDKVRADFSALGPDMLRDFDRSTEPLTVPVRELLRAPVAGGDEAPGAVQGVV